MGGGGGGKSEREREEGKGEQENTKVFKEFYLFCWVVHFLIFFSFSLFLFFFFFSPSLFPPSFFSSPDTIEMDCSGPVFSMPLNVVMLDQGKGFIPFVVQKAIKFLDEHC